jgi:hypothetical protein
MKNVVTLLPLGAAIIAVTLSGCTPTVRVEAPSEPIQINMNVKIEQEVRVRVERDLEEEFASNPELFGIPSASTKGTD